jgi:hypothetical protein
LALSERVSVAGKNTEIPGWLRNSKQSGDPDYGLNLRGPLGFLDAFVQHNENEDHTTKNLTSSVNMSINLPGLFGWKGRLGLLYQDVQNGVPGSSNSVTTQVSLSADHPFSWWGWKGTIAPGFTLRAIGDSQTSNETTIYPTLAFNIKRDAHSMDYSFGFNNQNRHAPGSIDVDTLTNALNYRYTAGHHTFGVEFTNERHKPYPGDYTNSYRAGTFWTYVFERPARAAAAPQVPVASLVAETGGRAALPDLSILMPGLASEKVQAMVERSAGKPIVEPGVSVYEVRMFDELDQRQRLALLFDKGRLTKSALIIRFYGCR